MPLKIIRRESGRMGPAVLCDHCDQEITDLGNVEWSGEEVDRGAATPYFTHKGCCAAFEKTRGGAWMTDELHNLPIRLAVATGMEPEIHDRDEAPFVRYSLSGRLMDF